MRIAVLISGRGSNLSALLAAAQADPAWPALIVRVISNIPGAAGLALAEAAGVPTATVPHAGVGGRAAFEAALQAQLEADGTQAIVLAGFMRRLTPEFTARWHDRTLNIHPSLLPAFPGLDTHARALAAGVKLHGATVHLVRPAVDEGPIILQAAVPVLDDDTPASLAARVLEQEHRILPQAVRWLAEGRLQVDGLRCTLRGGSAAAGAALLSPPLASGTGSVHLPETQTGRETAP